MGALIIMVTFRNICIRIGFSNPFSFFNVFYVDANNKYISIKSKETED
jgi:hypothetical protein